MTFMVSIRDNSVYPSVELFSMVEINLVFFEMLCLKRVGAIHSRSGWFGVCFIYTLISSFFLIFRVRLIWYMHDEMGDRILYVYYFFLSFMFVYLTLNWVDSLLFSSLTGTGIAIRLFHIC